MKGTATVITFLLFITQDVISQRLTVDRFVTHSSCTEGMIANRDNFTVEGTADMSGASKDDWPIIETCVRFINKADFSSVCFISLENCSAKPALLGCYCLSLGGDKYQLGYSQIATSAFSEAEIKFKVSNGSKTVESDVKNVSSVYEKGTELITLKVNNKTVNITSESCTFLFKPGTNTMQFCCRQSPSICKVTISHQGADVTGSPCAAFGHTVGGNGKGEYAFSYSVCGGATRNYNCQFSFGTSAAATNRKEHKEFVGFFVTVGLIAFGIDLSR